MDGKRALKPHRAVFRLVAPTLLLCCFSSQPGQAQTSDGSFDRAFAEFAAPALPASPSADAESRPLGQGMASYYSDRFHGRRTASGESFDKFALTAAHPTLPFGSLVRVTNPRNQRQVVVRINDRGPFTGRRVIDLSRAAAEQIDIVRSGHALVELELIESAPVRPTAPLIESAPFSPTAPLLEGVPPAP